MVSVETSTSQIYKKTVINRMEVIRKEEMDGIMLYVLKKSDSYHFATTLGEEDELNNVVPNYSIEFSDVNSTFHTKFSNRGMFEDAIISIPLDQFQDLMVFTASITNYPKSYYNNYLQVIFQEAFARVYPYTIDENEDLIIRYINFQLVFTLDTNNVLIITCGELHPVDDSITNVRAFAFTESYVNELFKSNMLNFDFILNHMDYRSLSKKIAAYYYHKKFQNLPEMILNKDIKSFRRIKNIALLLNEK